MRANRLICTGGAGAITVAICCFTPALVVLLSIFGLSAWLGWIDYVLFPALAIFIGVLGYGLYLRRRDRLPASCEIPSVKSSERI
jgi:mercuric ion transport protein